MSTPIRSMSLRRTSGSESFGTISARWRRCTTADRRRLVTEERILLGSEERADQLLALGRHHVAMDVDRDRARWHRVIHPVRRSTESSASGSHRSLRCASSRDTVPPSPSTAIDAVAYRPGIHADHGWHTQRTRHLEQVRAFAPRPGDQPCRTPQERSELRDDATHHQDPAGRRRPPRRPAHDERLTRADARGGRPAAGTSGLDPRRPRRRTAPIDRGPFGRLHCAVVLRLRAPAVRATTRDRARGSTGSTTARRRSQRSGRAAGRFAPDRGAAERREPDSSSNGSGPSTARKLAPASASTRSRGSCHTDAASSSARPAASAIAVRTSRTSTRVGGGSCSTASAQGRTHRSPSGSRVCGRGHRESGSDGWISTAAAFHRAYLDDDARGSSSCLQQRDGTRHPPPLDRVVAERRRHRSREVDGRSSHTRVDAFRQPPLQDRAAGVDVERHAGIPAAHQIRGRAARGRDMDASVRPHDRHAPAGEPDPRLDQDRDAAAGRIHVQSVPARGRVSSEHGRPASSDSGFDVVGTDVEVRCERARPAWIRLQR